MNKTSAQKEKSRLSNLRILFSVISFRLRCWSFNSASFFRFLLRKAEYLFLSCQQKYFTPYYLSLITNLLKKIRTFEKTFLHFSSSVKTRYWRLSAIRTLRAAERHFSWKLVKSYHVIYMLSQGYIFFLSKLKNREEFEGLHKKGREKGGKEEKR